MGILAPRVRERSEQTAKRRRKTRRAPPLEEQVVIMSGPDQSAELKLVVTNTLIVADIQRSVAFYRDVLGATVLARGRADVSAAWNIWLTINGGGGRPTTSRKSSLHRRAIKTF